jgi:Zn-dependent protease with chaperone function
VDKDINKLVITKEKVWFFIVSCLSLVVLFLFFGEFNKGFNKRFNKRFSKAAMVEQSEENNINNMEFSNRDQDGYLARNADGRIFKIKAKKDMTEKQLVEAVNEQILKENVDLILPTWLPTCLSIVVFILLFFGFQGILNGLFIGYLRQNSVRVSNAQFSDIHGIIEDYSKKLNIKVPKVYIMQSEGALNAFATRFLFKDIVVIFSDVLELAYAQGEDAVKFVIAHEFAHVKRKHVAKALITRWGSLVPFIGSAYSRACETTCDNIAAYLSGNNPEDGLLVLLAGKKLYSKVKIDAFLQEAETEQGFWSFLAEITSSHPNLSTRIQNIRKTKNISNISR